MLYTYKIMQYKILCIYKEFYLAKYLAWVKDYLTLYFVKSIFLHNFVRYK